MKRWTMGCIGGAVMLAMAVSAIAQEAPPERPRRARGERPEAGQRPERPARGERPAMTEAQREAMRERMQQRRQQQAERPEGDGDAERPAWARRQPLTEEERALVREQMPVRRALNATLNTMLRERWAQVLARFDEDGDGELSEEEIALMQEALQRALTRVLAPGEEP